MSGAASPHRAARPFVPHLLAPATAHRSAVVRRVPVRRVRRAHSRHAAIHPGIENLRLVDEAFPREFAEIAELASPGGIFTYPSAPDSAIAAKPKQQHGLPQLSHEAPSE